MKHLDLFSGIGGFALAVDRVFPRTEHIFCDNNEFCQQVLKHHYPNAKIFTDIRAITADTTSVRCNTGSNNREGGQIQKTIEQCVSEDKQTGDRWIGGAVSPSRIDLLTGGFPCQPFSQAGRRKGTNDDRFLWPEMLRVIRLTKPEWVIAENVCGILTIEQGMVFEQVCLDLEASGYEVQPFVIPAVAVNAPHRRDRVWFIANRKSTRGERGKPGKPGKPSQLQEGLSGWHDSGDDTHAASKCAGCGGGAEWERNWLEVATEFCRMDDGLPVELDGFELSKSANRRERLKSLGNAIVPKVAEEILKAISNSIKNQ